MDTGVHGSAPADEQDKTADDLEVRLSQMEDRQKKQEGEIAVLRGQVELFRTAAAIAAMGNDLLPTTTMVSDLRVATG